MRQTFSIFAILPLLSACAAVTLSAQAAPAKPAFRQMFLNQLKDVESKLLSLAEVTPEDKFGWRPADGVRSVSEVFMHVAGANYLFPTMVGVKAPSGIDPKMEKTVTQKAAVIEALKASFAHARAAVEGLSDADMDKDTKFFGRATTYQGVLFTMATHMHEHLGQSIAYARTNGVVPPWSKKEG
jgi:uncharacterized damage-inducible protein DinB